MSCSLNSRFRGLGFRVIQGTIEGTTIGIHKGKGDTRSLDYGSYDIMRW